MRLQVLIQLRLFTEDVCKDRALMAASQLLQHFEKDEQSLIHPLTEEEALDS